MDGLLDRFTGCCLYWLVWLGLTPSRWPWGACGTVILEVRGRRSGRLYSALVTWAEYAGDRYLVVMSAVEPQWVKNMRADDGHVILRHGPRRTDVVLRDVPRDQRAPILQVWYGTTGLSAHPRRHFGVDRHASIEEFERLAASHAVFRMCTASAPVLPAAPHDDRNGADPARTNRLRTMSRRVLVVSATTRVRRPIDVVRRQFNDVDHHATTRVHPDVEFIPVADSGDERRFRKIIRVLGIRVNDEVVLRRQPDGSITEDAVRGPSTGMRLTSRFRSDGPERTTVTATVEFPLPGLKQLVTPLLRPLILRRLIRALEEDRRDLEQGHYPR